MITKATHSRAIFSSVCLLVCCFEHCSIVSLGATAPPCWEVPPNSQRWRDRPRWTTHNINEEIKTKHLAQVLPNHLHPLSTLCLSQRAALSPSLVREVKQLFRENCIVKPYFPMEGRVVSELQEGPNQNTCVPDPPSCTRGPASAAWRHLLSTWNASFLLKMGLKDERL